MSTSTKGPPGGPTVMLVMLPLPLPELLMMMLPEAGEMLLTGAVTLMTSPARESSVTGSAKASSGMTMTVPSATVPSPSKPKL